MLGLQGSEGELGDRASGYHERLRVAGRLAFDFSLNTSTYLVMIYNVLMILVLIRNKQAV